MESLNTDQEKLRLEKLYATMVDDELLHLAEDMNSLTDLAQVALKAEIKHRGLSLSEVPQATPEPAPEPESMTEIVASFRDKPEALLAQGLLDAAEINSFLVDENMVSVLGTNATGGIRLLVREEDVDAALNILEAQETAQPLEEDSPEAEGDAATNIGGQQS